MSSGTQALYSANLSLLSTMAEKNAVVFLLIKDGKLLVEKRRKDKEFLPGATIIPGGSVEPGETIEEAVIREVKEELGVKAKSANYLCSMWSRKGSPFLLHFYIISAWEGEIGAHEAEETFWIGLDEEEKIETEVGQRAVREYRRLYQ